MTYPEDCLQQIIDDPEGWWIPHGESRAVKGSLIHAFIPHVDQLPYTFTMKGRTQPTVHDKADIVVAPLKVDQPLKQLVLPVAAMPLNKGEVWGAYRAKRRPCLVIKGPAAAVDPALTRGMPKSSSAPTMLVAPYYGVDRDGSRAGFSPSFVERIKHCEYPQFVWDRLPITGATDASILRLDQLQPIGAHRHSFKVLPFKMGEDAFRVIEDLLQWLIFERLPKGSDIPAFQDLMKERCK